MYVKSPPVKVYNVNFITRICIFTLCYALKAEFIHNQNELK